jgi:hypothetical protein
LEFVDTLRGVGLMCMVVDHAYDWWLIETENSGSWGRTTEFIGTLAAPIFLILVGTSMALATSTRRARGASDIRIMAGFVRRGLTIALWGYVVNLLVFFNGDNWGNVFAFDVLQCIGLGIVLFALVAVWGPTWTLLPLALVLGGVGQYADRLAPSGYLGTAISGIPDTAYFPLLPWICYIPMGILWGRTLAHRRDDAEILDRQALALLPLGLALLGTLAFVPPMMGYRHPRAGFIVFSSGIVAWLASGIYFLYRIAGGRSIRLLEWLRDMGRETLMLYVLHHLIGFRLLYWLGWVTGRSWREQYGLLDVPRATLLLIVLCGIMIAASRAWASGKRKSPTFKRIADMLS